MDFANLRYFAEVVRQQNVTKAASRLGIAQPALTRRIHLLEKEFGTPLLLRHRRGVRPTEAGLMVYDRAELLLRLAGEMRDDVVSRTAEPVGHIRLGCPPSVGNVFVAGLVSDYLRQFPRTTFYLSEQFTPAVREALLAGRLDLGIMSCEANHPDLQFEPLYQERLWLIGRPEEWPFKKSGTLSPALLVNKPLVLASLLRASLDRLGAEKGLQFNVRLEADALSTMREAMRLGAGFMLSPPSSVKRELDSGEFVGAPVRGLCVTRGLFWHRDRPRTRALQELAHVIQDSASILLKRQPKFFQPVVGAP